MAGQNGYRLIDSGFFYKLEQVGPYRLVRPSPQAVWRPRLASKEWDKHDAKFTRHAGGQGKWKLGHKKMQDGWEIEQYGLKFSVYPTDFGHLGLFPEHLEKFSKLTSLLSKDLGRKPKILNLFAYTGAATLAFLKAGAQVDHVDASKTSVALARKNLELNELQDAPVRWIVEDVRKFVQRQKRREVFYDGILLDPPSFGRGGKGEVWKIERDLNDLLDLLASMLSDEYAFLFLTSHSHGYSPAALSNLLAPFAGAADKAGSLRQGEMLLPEKDGRAMPSGAYALLKGPGACDDF